MDFTTLAGLRRHLTIKHHVPGRIRVKFDLAMITDPLVKELGDSGQSLPPGVLGARVNAMARSVILEYDETRIPPPLLEELVLSKDDARAADILRELETIIRNTNPKEVH